MKHITRILISTKNLYILIFLIPLVSCQPFREKCPDTVVYSGSENTSIPIKEGASQIAALLKNRNKNLETFKGIGQFKLVNQNKSITTRAAWIGTTQGYIRVEIFGFPGQSAARYSNDGRYSYLSLPLDGSFYIIDAVNPSLEKILTLPITSNDLNAYLSGKIPFDTYDEDKAKIDLSCDGYVLTLKQRGFGNIEKIYVDKEIKNVIKIEKFDLFGTLKYRTELNRTQSVNGYKIPFEIIISNNEGSRLYIHIDKYWTDTAVPLSTFTLTHP